MKYTYNKKTHKLKHKLKILLTILLAALISTTGYIISKNAFSANDEYEFPVIPANTNPNWYEDFEYQLSGSKITLTKYIGSGYTDYSIPGTAVINNITYSTYLGDDSDTTKGLFYNSDVRNLTVESGVGIINRPYCIFRNTPLETVDFSKLNTSNITGDSYWFFLSANIKAVNMGSFKFAGRINGFFDGCRYLEYVNLSNINTSSATNMSSMFNNCESIENIDLSNFNTSNVTDMSYMFKNCEKLINLPVQFFNTTRVTTTEQMFYGCKNLTNLDISSFITNNVTEMSAMFCGCNKLKTIDVSGFNTAKVTNMHAMFSDCYSVKFLDISGFDTSGVTSMYKMFGSSIYDTKTMNIETIYGLENFDTSNVNDMGSMFYNCSKLKTLNLSSFNTSNVNDMGSMFYNTPSLGVLYLGTNWNFLDYNSLEYSWKRDGNNTVYTAAQLTTNYNGSTMAGIYRRTDLIMNAIVYDSGELVFQIGSTPDSTKGNVLGTYTGFDSTTYNSASSVPWYNNRTTISTVTFKDYTSPVSTAYWFYGMTNLNKFNTLYNLDTSLVTTTKSMFENCTKLTAFNLNNIKANSLTNMNATFKGCTNLQSLNMSTFKAENLTNVTDIFTNTNLKTITLGDQTEFNILPTLSGTWKRDGDTSTTYTGNGVFAGPAGIYRLTTSAVYVIIYDNGEMVFQEGNTPDPTKGNVLGTYTGFETTSYNLYYSVP